MSATASRTKLPVRDARTPAELLRGSPWLSGIGFAGATRAGTDIGSTRQIQLETALAKLAEAEEKLAEQQERIAYLESLTVTDELTGLFNRRGFNSQFRRVLAAARRNGGTVAGGAVAGGAVAGETGGVMAMIDLDGFKGINDTHGHLAGDAYLRHVARFLAAHVREHDVVARLGGDEFAVLLTGTDVETGVARITELAAAAARETMTWDGHALPVRFSVGTQAYNANDREDDVLRQADVAMYRQKSQRRRSRRD